MAELRIGTAELPPGMAPARYFAALDLLETGLCRRGVPSDKVVRRWRAASPSRGLAVLAPDALFDRARPAAEQAGLLTRFADAVVALDAGAVVFRTPADLTPSSAGRQTLERFFAEGATADRFPGMTRVWHPAGLWDLGTSARFAAGLGGVVCAVDPLALDPGVDLTHALMAHLEVGEAYLRPAATGKKKLGEHDLDALEALIEPLERAWLVFADPNAWRSARELKKRLAALATDEADDGDEADDDDLLDGDDDEDFDDDEAPEGEGEEC